jgi:hypothetical protein
MKAKCRDLTNAVGKWTKLVACNTWGHHYFTYSGSELNERGTYDPGAELDIRGGDVVRVPWPDGSEQTVTVTAKAYHENVHDMGHVYPVSGTDMVVYVVHHGVKLCVPLSEFKVRRSTRSSRADKNNSKNARGPALVP